MRRIADWWSDLISVLGDRSVLLGISATGGLLALAALVAYTIWRWRVEKAFLELEIRDVLARADHYATAIPDTDAAVATRRREYLQHALERWMTLQYESWTDFQIYLAFRITSGIQPVTSHSAAELADGFREMLVTLWGNPKKLLASAALNNALATLFGMRPSVRRRQIFSESTDRDTTAADIETLLSLNDPGAMEDAVQADLEARGAAWLHRLLRVLERKNAHSRLTGRTGASNPLVLETVLWIVHEERVGPVPLSRELLDIYEVTPQLAPHLPAFLRDGAIESVQRAGTKVLTVHFRDVTLPRGTRFEGSVGMPSALRSEGKLWKSSRIEFDAQAGTGAVVFEHR